MTDNIGAIRWKTDPIGTLISEINSAGAEDQQILIRRAIMLAHDKNWISSDQQMDHLRFCDIGAYLSAAEVLAGDGVYIVRNMADGKRVGFSTLGYHAGPYDSFHTFVEAKAATPALALTSAALQAHKAKAEAQTEDTE